MTTTARSRRRRAFTLTELIVTVGLFSIFSTAVVAALNATLHFWRGSNNRIVAEQNVRLALQYITLELRQACPNPDPTTGWQSVSPALPQSTGILYPNINTSGSLTYLTFQEPDTDFYNPTGSSFNDLDPRNYQKVRYYVTNNELHREVVKYTSTGGIASTTDLLVVAATPPRGILTLTTRYIGEDYISVTVSTLEGECAFSLTTGVIALGQ